MHSYSLNIETEDIMKKKSQALLGLIKKKKKLSFLLTICLDLR